MADMKTLLLSKPMKGYELTAQLFRDISALGLASCRLFDRRRRQPPTTHPHTTGRPHRTHLTAIPRPRPLPLNGRDSGPTRPPTDVGRSVTGSGCRFSYLVVSIVGAKGAWRTMMERGDVYI